GFALKRLPPADQSLDAYWLIREVSEMYPDLEKISFSEQHRFSPSCQRLMMQLQSAMDDPTGKKLPGEEPDPTRLREALEELPALEDPLELANEGTQEIRVAILARSNDEVRQLEVGCSGVLQQFGRRVRVVGRSEGQGYPAWIGRVFGDPNAPERYT